MTQDRVTKLEVHVANQGRMLDDLNEVVARQSKEIDVLTRRLRMVMERLAEHDLATGDSVPLADQKPPHW